ncbi:MAG: diacylglycerol kinase family lipid kinase [Clostridiales bacterium]|nr:diacylglycerol kinase family lipid kinase [Clostridiales bacterium]
MHYFIVNPDACCGRAYELWQKIERRLEKTGLEYEVMLTEKCGDARIFARCLTESAADSRNIMVVVVGGDGTMNEVIDGLVFNVPVTLGFIPAGTGNYLARSLRLPLNWKRCLKKIEKPRYRQIGYGVLSYGEDVPMHRRFMESCGIGLDAAVYHSMLEKRADAGKYARYAGRAGYLIRGLAQLCRSEPVKGYLILDGVKKVELNRIYVVSASARTHEKNPLWRRAQEDSREDQLEVKVIHATSKLMILPMIVDAWRNQPAKRGGIRRYRCRELKVHLDRPMPVHVDGESCCCQTDIVISRRERKIRMIV